MVLNSRRFKSRRRPKRFVRRTRPMNRRRMRVVRPVPNAFPKTQLVRMNYCAEIGLDPVAGAIDYFDFAANGLFDPELTGLGGHQPYGFDNMMLAYDHYMVVGSKMTVRFVPTSTNSVVPGYLTVGLFDAVNQPLVFSNVEHMLESNRVNNNPVIAGFALSSTYRQPVATVYKTFSHKKFFNTPRNTSPYKGSITANPADLAVFSVMASSIGNNETGVLSFLVRIEYIVILSEPKILAQS